MIYRMLEAHTRDVCLSHMKCAILPSKLVQRYFYLTHALHQHCIYFIVIIEYFIANLFRFTSRLYKLFRCFDLY